MDEFLRPTDIIDWQHPTIVETARTLRGDAPDAVSIARRCFEWVRDEIEHTVDASRSVVTCAASEVLREGTGFCYAKSHLLAALLRANEIPAGLCYQRLVCDEEGRLFCLHGLTGVHLPDWGWYRVDPRGNRPGLDARFTPPREALAFAARLPGELDLPGVWADPLAVVVQALRRNTDAQSLARDLPDLAPFG